MGIIIREFRCGDCNACFESSDPVEDVVCPSCSSQEAERAFFTAPAIRSPTTSFNDRTVKQLAADYGLSDVSNKHGQPVRQAPSGPQAPAFRTGDAQAMQALGKLGGAADGFSQVLPTLQRSGRPHQWSRSKERQ